VGGLGAGVRLLSRETYSDTAMSSVPTADTGRPHTIAIDPPLGSATDMDAAMADVSTLLQARTIPRVEDGEREPQAAPEAKVALEGGVVVRLLAVVVELDLVHLGRGDLLDWIHGGKCVRV
jgi:hypothetical protein